MRNPVAPHQITIVQPRGHVNAANAVELQKLLKSAVSTHRSTILLVDMGQVESLDSAGLMALVEGFSLARHFGKRLSLCSVKPTIGMIFELTRLDGVFEIFDSPGTFEAAIA